MSISRTRTRIRRNFVRLFSMVAIVVAARGCGLGAVSGVFGPVEVTVDPSTSVTETTGQIIFNDPSYGLEGDGLYGYPTIETSLHSDDRGVAVIQVGLPCQHCDCGGNTALFRVFSNGEECTSAQATLIQWADTDSFRCERSFWGICHCNRFFRATSGELKLSSCNLGSSSVTISGTFAFETTAGSVSGMFRLGSESDIGKHNETP